MLVYYTKNINSIVKLQCLLNYIIYSVLLGIVIIYNHQVFYYLIIKIELTHFYRTKLLLTLRYLSNKHNNIMKFAN